MLLEILQSIWILIAAGIVLIVPGLAWQAWFPLPGRDPLEQVADAVGIGVSFAAVGALLTFILHIRLPGWGLAAIYLLLAGFAAAGHVYRQTLAGSRHYRRPNVPIQVWFGCGLAGLLFFLLVAWRMYQARDLALPAWVDSVHHVLLVRIFIDQGGLPATLGPELPVPLYYHIGYHALAAVYTALSRLSPDQATLIFGQVLNAVVSLSVYRLGKSVWGDIPRAAGAALIVGFVSHMPAYYLTWGRYTLLTGLILLPLAMAQAIDLTRPGCGGLTNPCRWIQTAFLALLTAGILLSHYLAAVLLALFLIVLAGGQAWKDLRARRIERATWAAWIAGVGAGLLAAAVWLVRVWIFSQRNFNVRLSLDSPDQVYFQDYLNYLWYLLGPLHNYVFLGLGGVGLVWALVRSRPLSLQRNPSVTAETAVANDPLPGAVEAEQAASRQPQPNPKTQQEQGSDWHSRSLAVWALILVLLTIPWGIRLGPFRPDHLAIVLFLPASLLASHLFVSMGEGLQRLARGKVPAWVPTGVILLGLSAWGLRDTANILNTSTILADAADLRAVEWVAGHTPPEANIWINVAPWQGPTYRGVDGGWWILPLTRRQTTLPPVVYAWGEQDYVVEITAWAKISERLSGCGPEFWALMRQAHVTHVYLHEGKGSLQPAGLQGCAGVEPVYHEDGVWIYEVKDEG